MALFKDGNLVHFIEKHHIEGRISQMITDNLKDKLLLKFNKKNFVFSKIESENLYLI